MPGWLVSQASEPSSSLQPRRPTSRSSSANGKAPQTEGDHPDGPRRRLLNDALAILGGGARAPTTLIHRAAERRARHRARRRRRAPCNSGRGLDERAVHAAGPPTSSAS